VPIDTPSALLWAGYAAMNLAAVAYSLYDDDDDEPEEEPEGEQR